MPAIYFGPDDRPLYGFYSMPQPGGSRRTTGVLICAPLGYEATCAHRSLRELAHRLCAVGFPVLRFDYDGTGDSAGSDADPGRVEHWIASVGHAIEALKRTAEVERVCVVGLRVGALLAAQACDGRDDVSGLVLWASHATGKAYWREMRARQALMRSPKPSSLPRDTHEIVGFRVRDDAATALQSLTLHTIRSWPTQVLVLEREGHGGGDEPISASLANSVPDFERRNARGYDEMMFDPHQSQFPVASFDELVGWIASRHMEVIERPRGRQPMMTPRFASRPYTVTSTVEIRWRLAEGSSDWMREEVIDFGEFRTRLFGIVTELEGTAPSDRPVIVFLNAGAVRHVGPNRNFVELSRELAAVGFRCVRIDLRGTGDSDGHEDASQYMYSEGGLGDVQAALDWLVRNRDARRFVLVGLCSGAFQAYQMFARRAVRDIAGLVIMNPQTFVWRDGDAFEVKRRETQRDVAYYREAALDPQKWRKALRGDIQVRYILRVAGDRLAHLAERRADRALRTLGLRAEPQSDVFQTFARMLREGVQVLTIFSEGDPGLEYLEGHLGRRAERLLGSRNLEFEVIPEADHTFTSLQSQETMKARITRYLRDRFPR